MNPPSRGFDVDRFRKGAGTASAPPSGVLRAEPVQRERRAQSILDRIDTLPSLPGVVMQVLQLANDEQAGANDFEKIISRDQGLAARVLKLVNSPFFAMRRRIESIPQAIVALGMKSLRSVVLASRSSGLLNRQLGPYGLDDSGLWQHSTSCATIAGRLVKRVGGDAEEEQAAFAAGLLHDVGKIVLAPLIAAEAPVAFDQALRAHPGDVLAAERAVLGTTHPEVGGRMGRKWDLPDRLVHVIETHHDPPGGEPDRVALAVMLADDLVNGIGVGRKDDGTEPSPHRQECLDALGLADQGDKLVEETRAIVEELEPVFRELASG